MFFFLSFSLRDFHSCSCSDSFSLLFLLLLLLRIATIFLHVVPHITFTRTYVRTCHNTTKRMREGGVRIEQNLVKPNEAFCLQSGKQ